MLSLIKKNYNFYRQQLPSTNRLDIGIQPDIRYVAPCFKTPERTTTYTHVYRVSDLVLHTLRYFCVKKYN